MKLVVAAATIDHVINETELILIQTTMMIEGEIIDNIDENQKEKNEFIRLLREITKSTNDRQWNLKKLY